MTQTHQQHRPPLLGKRESYVAVTDAAYTAKAGDQVMGVNRSGVVTITLPSAEVRPGRIYTVKDESGNANSNNITVATEGSETIDGAATQVLSTDYEAVFLYSDGTNWFVAPRSAASHAQAHTAASHSDQGATGAELETLTDGSTTTLHEHTQADQTAIEAQTNENSYIPPDLAIKGPWAVKASLHIIADGTLDAGSLGITSVDDDGAGDRGINLSTSFSSVNYVCVMNKRNSVGYIQVEDQQTGNLEIRVRDDGGSAGDQITTHNFVGDT